MVSYKQYCSSSRASSEAMNVASENGDQEFKYLLEEKEKEISVRHFTLPTTYNIQIRCSRDPTTNSETKCQLISKCLFGVFSSSKRRT